MKKLFLSAAILAGILFVPKHLHASETHHPIHHKYDFKTGSGQAWLKSTVHALTHPSELFGKGTLIKKGTEVEATGINSAGQVEIQHENGTYYVDQSELLAEEPVAAPVWNGPVLTRSAGAIQGPSGKETYYNLDMSGVVNIMRGLGNTDEYWVREDGAKMLGDFVMVAANFNLRPRGSYVQTSLGMGIVCDTGGFASHNPTQIDIATAW